MPALAQGSIIVDAPAVALNAKAGKFVIVKRVTPKEVGYLSTDAYFPEGNPLVRLRRIRRSKIPCLLGVHT